MQTFDQRPWDLVPVEIPMEWFIHTVSIANAPTAGTAVDDEGGRVATPPAAVATNVPAFVEQTGLSVEGPEGADYRMTQKRTYMVWTPANCDAVVEGATVTWNGKTLSVRTVDNVHQFSVLWKLDCVLFH